MFVHGIGDPRDPVRELTAWTGALAAGMREAGHSAAARALFSDGPPDRHVLVHYTDLFGRAQAHGGDAPDTVGDAESEIFAGPLVAWVEGLSEENTGEDDRRILEDARRRPNRGPRNRAAWRSTAGPSTSRRPCSPSSPGEPRPVTSLPR